MTNSVFPQSVHEYYVQRMRQLADACDEKIGRLKTKAAAERHRLWVKRTLRKSFGKLPKRTPLNLQVTGRFERKGYHVDKLLYESRPGYYVTANLYVPNGDGPFPAVLVPCGHSPNGKAWDEYQALCRGLALRGFMTLIYDPASQGERAFQYPKEDAGNCCYEHTMAGNHMTLVGDFFGAWRVWDGIRSLDVLLSRGDVDKTRVGLSGCSGGGTLTTYLNLMDDRFTMSAPDCFVTTYLANMENEMPADAEQMPPGILAAGLDMADFFIAQAPRPTILLGEYRDAFDSRGLEKTFERIGRVYHLLGAGNAIEMYIGDGTHGYWQGAREACYGFFGKHAGVRVSSKEKKTATETERTLKVTKTGNVLDLPGVSRACDFTAEAAEALAKQRGSVSASKLSGLLPKVLNLPKRDSRPPHYRAIQPVGGKDVGSKAYPYIWRFGLETEPDFEMPLAVLHRFDAVRKEPKHAYVRHPETEADAVLLLPHASSIDDVVAGVVPKPKGHVLFALDVRGIGAVKPNSCNNPPFEEVFGGEYFYAAHGQMLGESYVGRRVHDVLRALDLLQDHGAKRVHLVGRGVGSVLATFAGLLHPLVKQVTLHNALRSYHELATTDVYRWPLSVMPWAVLKYYDLPDCYAALKRKKLRITDFWDARLQPARRRKGKL